jgi:Sulfotransferase family
MRSNVEMLPSKTSNQRIIKPTQRLIILLIMINVVFRLNNFHNLQLTQGNFQVPFDDVAQIQLHQLSVQQHSSLKHVSSHDRQELLVQYGDSIYVQNDWDGAPIVLEEYKLLFFSSPKVGCTTWKHLFRRMMGATNYTDEDEMQLLPWNPELYGLKYLYHYNRSTASEMMTNPNWTRALFVRDPKERFLSAYLDKVIETDYFRKRCCPYTSKCSSPAKESLQNFLDVMYICDDAHWRPQSKRIKEEKYWPYINYVGHMDNLYIDSKRLLQRIGAWEKYGMSGWGTSQEDAIFQSNAEGAGRNHATHAAMKLKSYITPEIEQALEEYYADDYTNRILNLALHKLY